MSLTIQQFIYEYQNVCRDKNSVFMPLDDTDFFLHLNQELKALNAECEYAFSRTSQTITTIAGTQCYDLTAGFQMAEGSYALTRDSDGMILAPMTEEEARVFMEGSPSHRGDPYIFFLRVKPGVYQRYQVGFVPFPSSAKAYTFVGKSEPTEITATAPATDLSTAFPVQSPWHRVLVYRLAQLTFEIRNDDARAIRFEKLYELEHKRTLHHFSQAGLNPGYVNTISESFNRAHIGGQSSDYDPKPTSWNMYGRITP